MTDACRRIGELIVRIQMQFLETPGLALTPAQARNRFGVDELTCDALFEALTDARVLVRTTEGAYVQFQPPASACCSSAGERVGRAA
jgi:hypothetical protein